MYRVYDHYKDINELTALILKHNYNFKEIFPVITYAASEMEIQGGRLVRTNMMKIGDYEVLLVGLDRSFIRDKPKEAAEIAMEKILHIKKYVNLIDPQKGYYHDSETFELCSYIIDDYEDIGPLSISLTKKNADYKSRLIQALTELETKTKIFIDSYINVEKRIKKETEDKRNEKERNRKEKFESEEYHKVKNKIELKYNNGLDFFNSSKFPEAIYSFSQAIELDKLNRYENDLYFHRGNAKYEAGDYIGCIGDMGKSKAKKTDPIQKLFKIGISYYNLKKYEEAIKQFNELILLDEFNKEALYFRGLCKINTSLKDEGCLDLSKSGELGYFDAYNEIKKHCN